MFNHLNLFFTCCSVIIIGCEMASSLPHSHTKIKRIGTQRFFSLFTHYSEVSCSSSRGRSSAEKVQLHRQAVHCARARARASTVHSHTGSAVRTGRLCQSGFNREPAHSQFTPLYGENNGDLRSKFHSQFLLHRVH